MKLSEIGIRNFRRLVDVKIDIEEKETIFVGPNNSGKTTATAIFRCFLGGREFSIYDFSVILIPEFQKFVDSNGREDLPEINLDLWFKIDPSSIAFGQAFHLLDRYEDLNEIGIRLSLVFEEPAKLKENYFSAYPEIEGVGRNKSLFQYLNIDNNFKIHTGFIYHALYKRESESGGYVESELLDYKIAKDIIKKLLKVEFVDAQRNINDNDDSGSNRLSSAFATFYNKNLKKADLFEEAHKVIDENNEKLSLHYKKQFKPLLDLIRGLGVPSASERELKIISSLSPETALKGNTDLLYVDSVLNHELPELYNGLGFKNLIYMAIQARHFHSQWISLENNRPFCLLIFIEEPEAHLHAQVQQTFINNVWKVINDASLQNGITTMAPQIIVTTHSTHILDSVDFEKVRYFQRCKTADVIDSKILNASSVHSLRAFRPEIELQLEEDDQELISQAQALTFLKQYLRLTHCDLFFSDAAILVEGAVEKLLMPSMIDKVASRLGTTFLTILEVGGAFAHRFEGLLKFLHIPYLVITDLDSVEPQGRLKTCRADVLDARTSNASLKRLCKKNTISELINMNYDDKISIEHNRFIAFGMDVNVIENGSSLSMRPRTLEEAIAYENFSLLRSDELYIGIKIPKDLRKAYDEIYNHIRSDSFKKTDFAMRLLINNDWVVPSYITEGLKWLEGFLCPTLSNDESNFKLTISETSEASV